MHTDFLMRRIPVLVLVLMLGLPAAVVAQRAGGLDALDEDRVLSELAARGLETLLERALEVGDVPEQARAGVRALAALTELTRAEEMPAVQRAELVQRAVAGVDQALATVNDPQVLMQQAALLARFGVEPEVNTLEYWGEDGQAREKLRPAVEAVQRLLEKAATEAEAAAEQVGERLSGPDDPRIERWIELDRLATVATYTRHMMAYDLALALEPGDERREEVAARAIEYLQQFDHAESQVQAVVRLRLGKLEMARGRMDEAMRLFASIVAGETEPAADTAQQFEARYFLAMCRLLAGDAAEARRGLEELIQWQETALQSDESARDSARAAAAMLRHRIHLLEAEQAADDERRRELESVAREVLVELVREQPAFAGRVLGQLGTSLPEDADVSQLDPLELAALLRRGDVERMRDERQAVNRAALEQAVAAAREIMRRAGEAGEPDRRPAGPESVPALGEVEEAAIRLPMFLLRLERDAEAAEALLAYLEEYGAEGAHAEVALEQALAVVGRLRRAGVQDSQVEALYDRVLEIATGEGFTRHELAYEHARRLHAAGKLAEAIAAYRQVPREDPRRLHARYYEMVALQRRLEREDRQLGEDERQAMQRDVLQLAAEVTRLAEQQMMQADEGQREGYCRVMVRTMLLSADTMRRDAPAEALRRLSGVEGQAAGLENEQDLLAEAQFIRVHSHMALGQNNEAAEALVKLLESHAGGHGADIVFGLLSQLDGELEVARTTGDEAGMRQLAQSRAMLSGFLVEWAREHAEEEIRRFTYRYMVFDAATQHLAAQLEPDATRRVEMLRHALGRYEALLSAENVQLYRQTIADHAGVDSVEPDPAVVLGMALVQFDLGNYGEAQPLLGRLLSQRRLGGPRIAMEEEGEVRFRENERYWEAQYKLMRSNVELARAQQAGPEAMEATRRHLAMLYIREGNEVGGRKWREAFEGLREELGV
jgi:predicted negative regulator of RcsB-dependent stress response